LLHHLTGANFINITVFLMENQQVKPAIFLESTIKFYAATGTGRR
jgi:hypothetical protein